MDGEILLRNLADLGRQLDQETTELGRLDVIATGQGITATHLKEAHEDAVAEAFKDAEGSVEARKMEARLKCVPARLLAQEASADFEKAKAKVRNQQAIVRALNTRIDIGRSLLSHEKALMGLGG